MGHYTHGNNLLQITFSDKLVSNLKNNLIKKNISYGLQNDFIFSGTIKSNINILNKQNLKRTDFVKLMENLKNPNKNTY